MKNWPNFSNPGFSLSDHPFFNPLSEMNVDVFVDV